MQKSEKIVESAPRSGEPLAQRKLTSSRSLFTQLPLLGKIINYNPKNFIGSYYYDSSQTARLRKNQETNC